MLFLAFGALYVLPVSALGRHQAPGAAVPLPSGYTHVLLIGADMDASGTSRSDTMVICSVGEGRVLLTSLQRDTGVIIPGYSGLSRLNAAYHYGGAKLLLETVNRNFGLDLSLYALVDYDSFPPLIDALGGVDFAGIPNEEANQVNANIYELLLRQYKQGVLNKEQAQKEFIRLQLKGGGDLHLNGAQALGYARIRKTDSDYGRTLRQRKVLSAAIRSLKSSGPFSVTRFAVKCFRALETNMNTLELISLGEKALFSSEIRSFCMRCGEVLEAQTVLPALGHDIEVREELLPTCTQDGHTRGETCRRCGEVFLQSETLPALGHAVQVLERKEPTCTEDGCTQGS